MKQYLILTILVTNLFSWSFTKEDYKKLNSNQLEVLNISLLVGSEYSEEAGYILAGIAGAETRFGLFDFNKNHICGSHQLNINLAKTECHILESNSYVSAKLALDNLLFWKRNRSWDKAIVMYLRGYKKSNHDKEYLRRVKQVIKTIKEYNATNNK